MSKQFNKVLSYICKIKPTMKIKSTKMYNSVLHPGGSVTSVFSKNKTPKMIKKKIYKKQKYKKIKKPKKTQKNK